MIIRPKNSLGSSHQREVSPGHSTGMLKHSVGCLSRQCSENFIQIISPWIGAAFIPFLWLWRLRLSCLLSPECTCLLSQVGPRLVVLECRKARCHAQLLSWLPRAVSCAHRTEGGCLMNHHYTQVVRSSQDGAELGPPLRLWQLCHGPGDVPMEER